MRFAPEASATTCGYCGFGCVIEGQPLPAPVPTYGAPSVSRRAPTLLFAFIALGVIGAAGIATVATLNAGKPSASSPQLALPPSVAVLATATPAKPPALAIDLYRDPTPLRLALARDFGSAPMAQSLTIYREYAGADLQDPKNPTHIDQHFWINGAFNAPSPTTQNVSDADLPTTLFRVADFDFALVPHLVEVGLREIPVEDGKVTHIIIDREPRRTPRINVYVSNDRGKGGRVEFSLQGVKRHKFP